MTVNFVVRTAAGRAIYTSPDSDLALRFARKNRATYPGIYVESERVTVTTKRIWTDRKAEARGPALLAVAGVG